VSDMSFKPLLPYFTKHKKSYFISLWKFFWLRVQTILRAAASYSGDWETPCCYRAWRFISVFTKTPQDLIIKSKSKVKLSLYCHAGTKGERLYSSYSFLTSAVDGDEWSASHSGCALSLRMDLWYPLERKMGGPRSWSGHRG
jgi:hypothetical protein